MRIKLPSLQRPVNGLLAAAFVAAVAIPLFIMGNAAAYGQMTTRSIQMSSGAPSAASQTYVTTFTPQSATVIKAIVIDFCDGSPIIANSTCVLPTGMTVGSSSIVVTGPTGGTWTGSVANSRTLTLSNTSSTANGASVSASVGGFTNPSTANHTFYARILTYSSTTTGYGSPDAGTIGTPLDAAGIALSTSTALNVSGTVQETLIFCTSGTAFVGANCSDSLTAPTLALGTGTPAVLGTVVATGSVYSQISTNAGSGAVIRMRNSNACSGLSKDGGTTCPIAPASTGAGAQPIANGSALFGVEVSSTGGSGTLTSQGDYASGTNYGMNSNVSTGVSSTYGDTVASSTGVLGSVNTTYKFAAAAGSTTPAGVYTAQLTLIATGTY